MINSQFEHFHQKFFDEWQSGSDKFAFETSGSTGTKKTIMLSRNQLLYSAQTSLAYLDPDSAIKKSLLCIRPDFIGGAMVLVRAWVGNHSLTRMDPVGNILEGVGDTSFDLVSLVPLQVQSILETDPSRLLQFKTILIGGAPLGQPWVDRIIATGHPRVFQSYGMTETASHIALKHLGVHDYYETLGDVEISASDRQTLQIKGTVTDHNYLETNDLIELISSNKFLWLGRSDHIINTGGVKVNPEEVEAMLAAQIRYPFFVTGLPDAKLGSAIALVMETNDSSAANGLDFSQLPKYSRPKQVKTLSKFIYTDTSKINRTETIKLL